MYSWNKATSHPSLSRMTIIFDVTAQCIDYVSNRGSRVPIPCLRVGKCIRLHLVFARWRFQLLPNAKFLCCKTFSTLISGQHWMQYKNDWTVWKIATKVCFRHKIPRFLYREMLDYVICKLVVCTWPDVTPVHDDIFVGERSSIKTTVVFFS